jgi:hypothetical protein
MLDWDEMKWTACKCVGDKPSGRSQHSARYARTYPCWDAPCVQIELN